MSRLHTVTHQAANTLGQKAALSPPDGELARYLLKSVSHLGLRQ